MSLGRSVVLAALVALAGCAEPIVLRPAYPEHQAMHRARPRGHPSTARPGLGGSLARSSPAPASPVLATAPSEELAGAERGSDGATLTAEQKESLFRDFDAYLRWSGNHYSDKPPGAAAAGRPASSTAGMAASAALAAPDHPAPGD